MKISFKMLAMVFAMTMAISGCKKKDDSPEPDKQPDKTTLLSNTWKMTNFQLPSPYNLAFNLWDSVPDCEKDNLYTLNSDGSGTFDQADLICDTTIPKISTLTWMWLNNETDLKVTGAGDTLEIKSVTITSTTLKGKMSYFLDSLELQANLTMTKQ